MLKGLASNPFGKPMYRVVFSDHEMEVRNRTYKKTSKGGIYLGMVTEAVECKKYPTIEARWLLEVWVPPNSVYTNEIVSAREHGSYECIYIFQSENSSYLPLNLDVAKIVAMTNLHPGRFQKITDDSDTAMFNADEKEKNMIETAVAEEYEKVKSTTANNRYLDGMQLSINPTKKETKSVEIFNQ